MQMSEDIVKTPWDERAFHINTYEIKTVSEEVMAKVASMKGHFTVKVDPLSSKEILSKYGFYYCDTLIEPHIIYKNFIYHAHEHISISEKVDLDRVTAICHGAFSHGASHRDFNINKQNADLRYDLWLKDLYNSKNIFNLLFEQKTAGFFGFTKNRIVLYALHKDYQGKGLSKYFFSVACKALFDKGYDELISSISVSNCSVLNLHASLGFRFRNPLDVYHLFNASHGKEINNRE